MIFSYETNIYGAVVGVGFLEEYMNEDGNNGFLDHKICFFVVDME